MARTETVTSGAPHKMSVMVPILSGLLAAGLVGGGVIFYLSHNPRTALTVVVKEEAGVVTLDPFLVNLSDPGGHGYLKVSMVLETTAPAAEKKPEGTDPAATQQKAAMRDCILTVLSSQSAEALLAPGGKDALKKSLMDQLNKPGTNLKVKEIYFTEFLVQQ